MYNDQLCTGSICKKSNHVTMKVHDNRLSTLLVGDNLFIIWSLDHSAPSVRETKDCKEDNEAESSNLDEAKSLEN